MPPELTKDFLEKIYTRHHRLEKLSPDPLLFGRGYPDPLEGETAALIASTLAYGRVEKIVEALGFVFSRLGDKPRERILGSGPEEFKDMFQGFAYRFHKGPDLAVFMLLLKRAIELKGDLVSLFLSGDDGDYANALSSFGAAIIEGDPRPLVNSATLPKGHPARYLIATPRSGCAAKRLCLFMRWMARRDDLDPGYWEGRVDKARLVVPLDTHVAKVGRFLGMTGRKSADWKTAEEITLCLKRFYPFDPLRADFSLFRYGMKDLEEALKFAN